MSSTSILDEPITLIQAQRRIDSGESLTLVYSFHFGFAYWCVQHRVQAFEIEKHLVVKTIDAASLKQSSLGAHSFFERKYPFLKIIEN